MIGVELKEEAREFEVRVGRLKIGKVVVFPWCGKAAAYVVDGERSSGYRFLDGAATRTLKQAADRVLRSRGFGNCSGVEVKRAPGGLTQ